MPPRYSNQYHRRRYSGPPDVAKELRNVQKELAEEREKTQRRITQIKQQRNQRQQELSRGIEDKTPQKSPRVSLDTQASGETNEQHENEETANLQKSPRRSRGRLLSQGTTISGKSARQSGDPPPKGSLAPNQAQSPRTSTGNPPKQRFRNIPGSTTQRSHGVSFEEEVSHGTDLKPFAAQRQARLSSETAIPKAVEKSPSDLKRTSLAADFASFAFENERVKRVSRKGRANKEEPPLLPTIWQQISHFSLQSYITSAPPLRSKLRGRYATTIHIPLLFRLMSNQAVMIAQEAFMCFILFLSFMLDTFQFFFGFQLEWRTYLLTVIDFIVLSELLIRLLFEVIRHRLRLHYILFFLPTTPEFFVLMAIYWAPIDYCFRLLGFETMGQMRILDLLKLNHVFGFLRIFYFVEILDYDHYVSESGAFCLQFFSFFIYAVHLTSCLNYYMTGLTTIDQLLHRNLDKMDTWWWHCNKLKPDYRFNPFGNYVLSSSYTDTIISSLGFGDCVPINEMEMIFAIIAMLVFVVYTLSYFLGSMTSFSLARDGNKYDLYLRQQLIQDSLVEKGAPALLVDKIQEYYYECLWNFRLGVFKVESLRVLPLCMYEDVLFDICCEMFEKSPLLRELEAPFLRTLSKTAEVLLFNPEMIICHRGESPRALYYIIHGECRVSSTHETSRTSAVLRGGCIFGESSLLFPFPYTAEISTSSTCQLLVIRRQNFVDVCEKFPYALDVMRRRYRNRISKMNDDYQMLGIDPIVWIQQNETCATNQCFLPTAVFDYPETKLYWTEGFNSSVPQDTLQDAVIDDAIIVDMPYKKKLVAGRYDHVSTYRNCVIPPTLANPHPFLRFWHMFIAVFSTFEVLLITIGAILKAAQSPDHFADIVIFIDALTCVIFSIDVAIEVLTATPATGLYFRLRDGLIVKRKEMSFYLNIAAALSIPGGVFNPFENHPMLHEIHTYFHGIFFRYLITIVKVSRYIDYLGEKFPERLFLMRLIQTTTYFILSIATVATALYWRACPTQKSGIKQCRAISWLVTDINVTSDSMKKRYDLLSQYPLLLSWYFSASCLTTTGYGDFTIQSLAEVVFLYMLQFWSFMTGVFTAKMTSALIASSLDKVRLEEKLMAIQIFFQHRGISMRLRDRVNLFYKLQHQYNKGVVLPPGINFLMYDAPLHLYEDVVLSEMDIPLNGVPIFTMADPAAIVNLSRLMHRYVIPPNITFIHRGEVRRQMYIVSKGSVGILKENTEEVKGILEATGHFGVRDLIYGEPAFNNVVTLSYCVLNVIDYSMFSLVFAEDHDLMESIEQERLSLDERIKALTYVFSKCGGIWQKKQTRVIGNPSWITFPTSDATFKSFCDYGEFEHGYKGTKGFLMKYLLMRRTIHPAGTFAVVWCIFTATVALIPLIIITMRIYAGYISRNFLFVLYIVKFIFALDVYLRMHWAFYTETNYLVCHPVATAKHYFLDGPFFWSLFLELVENSWSFWILGATQWTLEGPGVYWALKLDVLPLVSLLRFHNVLQFGHNLSQYRTIKLCLIYIVIAFLTCAFLGGVALYVACPWSETERWSTGNTGLLPPCHHGTWMDKSTLRGNDVTQGARRWLIAIYYIHQALFSLGYGDLVSFTEHEMWLLIFVMIFGFLGKQCIVSDMTATTSNDDNVRNKLLEKLRTVKTIMRKHQVEPELIRSVDEYFERVWQISQGITAHDLFSDLHPGLQADFFREYIGDLVAKAPIFRGVNESILRKICTEIRRHYFFRGDHLARHGNIELEMYIIIDGDIWIRGKDGGVRCTLGPGETFGEADMMYGTARRHSAVAVNDVQVFALNAPSFATILEHYPGLRQHMEVCIGGRREDMFERKNYFLDITKARLQMMDPEIWQSAMDRIGTNAQAVVLEATPVTSKEGWGLIRFCKRYLIGWGPHDINLPFLYFARPDSGNKLTFMLHPRCGFQRLFSTVVDIVCLCSTAAVSFIIAYVHDEITEHDRSIITLNIFVVAFEIIYRIHILLQFFTPFTTVDGMYCKEHRKIVIRYIEHVSRFWLDLVSIIPFPIASSIMNYDDSHRHIFLYANLNRLLRLVHYFRSQREQYQRLHVTLFRYNLAICIPSLLLIAHFIACIFYGISRCTLTPSGDYLCDQNSWTYRFLERRRTAGLPGEQAIAWRWYIRSVYWVITTATTTGFGDIVPVNISEVIVTLICSFAGTFLLAIFLSQFTAGVASIQKHRLEYFFDLKADVETLIIKGVKLQRHLKGLGLSSYVTSTLTEWLLLRWIFCRGMSFHEAFSTLPLSMRNYISRALYHKHLCQVALFKDLDDTFFTSLSAAVGHTMFLPGQIIANEGDKGTILFIIISGRVAGYLDTRKGNSRLMRWYKAGSIFGRLPVLFYDGTYTKSYRSSVLTEVLTLSRRSIFYLARYYPAFATRLRGLIEERYDPRLGTFTILSPEVVEEPKFTAATAKELVAQVTASKVLIGSTRKPKKRKKQVVNAELSSDGKRKRRKKASKFIVSYTQQRNSEAKEREKAYKIMKAFESVHKAADRAAEEQLLNDKAKELLKKKSVFH